jgi:hypothetical protein
MNILEVMKPFAAAEIVLPYILLYLCNNLDLNIAVSLRDNKPNLLISIIFCSQSRISIGAT